MEFREQLVPEATLEDWQTIVDLVARLSGVKAALIMKAWFEADQIEVLVSSRTAGNPYHPGEKETLRSSGLYCERVLQDRGMLCVRNALTSPEWCRNPDIKLGMVSYLGLPILQPDGQPFGTICILDDQEYIPSPDVITLLEKMRDFLEGHLRFQDLVSQLREALEKVKTLSGMLPICSHCKQIRDDEGYWQRLERYIEARTEATFSHGLCPACTWKLYPEMAAELETEMETGA